MVPEGCLHGRPGRIHTGDKTVERTILLVYRIALRAVLYFGVGFICHWFFVGDGLDPGSALTWAYVLAWPLMLFLKFILYLLGFLVLVVAVIVAGVWYDDVRTKARMRRAAEAVRASRARDVTGFRGP